MKTKKDRAASRERRRSDRAVLLRLVQEAKPIYKWLALACLISLGIIACAVAAPQLLGDCVQLLYDYWAGSFTGASLTAALTGGCLALAGVYLLQGLMSWLKMLLLNNVVSRYFTCALRIKLSAKISRLPVSFVDRTPVGQILDRMTEDVSTMGNSIHSIIDTLMVGFLQIIAIAVMMLLEDWRLALVVILFMPVSVLLSIKISNLSGKHFERMFAVGGQRFAHVEESFTNYQTTKAYNYEQATIETLHRVFKRARVYHNLRPRRCAHRRKRREHRRCCDGGAVRKAVFRAAGADSRRHEQSPAHQGRVEARVRHAGRRRGAAAERPHPRRRQGRREI